MNAKAEWIEDDGEALIDEVRAVRRRISAQFEHDPYRLVSHYIDQQKQNESRLIRAVPSDGVGESLPQQTRIAVLSSQVASVSYDERSQVLEVQFANGEVYQYFDVPESHVRDFLEAFSDDAVQQSHQRAERAASRLVRHTAEDSES